MQVKTVAPVGDRVFVRVEEPEAKTVGGILLPSSATKKPTSGEVVAAGAAKGVKVRARGHPAPPPPPPPGTPPPARPPS